MWAAYRKNTWPVSVFPKGLSSGQFTDQFIEKVQGRTHLYMVEAQTVESGMVPVGLVAADTLYGIMLPHFQWFPWSSDRNKLEGATAFFDQARTHVLAWIMCEEIDAKFYKHIAEKYHILRPIGHAEHGFGVNSKAVLYELKPRLPR